MTNEKREDVKRKIEKLLNLADNSAASEGEIENALKAAQTLMMKYHIENDELGHNEGETPVEKSPVIRRPEEWFVRGASKIVCDNFRCFGYTLTSKGCKSRIVIVGYEEDATIVCHMLEVITRFIIRESGRVKNAGDRNTFRKGILDGIKGQLQKNVSDSGFQMVVVTPPAVIEAVQNTTDGKFVLRKAPSVQQSARREVYMEGYIKGSSLKFNKSLDAN